MKLCGAMKLKVIVHEAEEGGYWAEVPSIPGCATQGETFEELSQNIYEPVEGCMSVDVTTAQVKNTTRYRKQGYRVNRLCGFWLRFFHQSPCNESSRGLSGGVPFRQSERQSIGRDSHSGCELKRILAPGRKSQLDKIRRETFRGRSYPNVI